MKPIVQILENGGAQIVVTDVLDRDMIILAGRGNDYAIVPLVIKALPEGQTDGAITEITCGIPIVASSTLDEMIAVTDPIRIREPYTAIVDLMREAGCIMSGRAAAANEPYPAPPSLRAVVKSVEPKNLG